MTSFGPAMPRLSEVRPGVRRLVAPNPSMMTGPGTNTYLFGEREIAVLDPGPLLEDHIDRIIDVAGAPIRWILVTHTHEDHSPAASALASVTGAELLGRPAPEGKHQDATFVPDRSLGDGDELTTDEFSLLVVHTPGHASNHVCFLHRESDMLFTGDHVIDGSTVVINPPDGNMKHYLQSLRRVRDLDCAALAPGHGEIIDTPRRVIDWIIQHRLEREARVSRALSANPGLTTHQLVPEVYQDVDPRLYGWAERSLQAHLLKLEDDGAASCRDGRWVATDQR